MLLCLPRGDSERGLQRRLHSRARIGSNRSAKRSVVWSAVTPGIVGCSYHWGTWFRLEPALLGARVPRSSPAGEGPGSCRERFEALSCRERAIRCRREYWSIIKIPKSGVLIHAADRHAVSGSPSPVIVRGRGKTRSPGHPRRRGGGNEPRTLLPKLDPIDSRHNALPQAAKSSSTTKPSLSHSALSPPAATAS